MPELRRTERGLRVNPEDLFGLQARALDGTRFGRITDVFLDEETGEVSYVVAERGAESFEVPISSISLDQELDFVVFHADRSDVGPNDHVGDEEEERAVYAPARWEERENARDAVLYETVEDPDGEVVGPAERARENWEDASFDPGSGYPRNDIYIDRATGEEEIDPLVRDDEGLTDEVEELLSGTGLRARNVAEGSVELEGRAGSPEALRRLIAELEGLAGVVEVDATDADPKETS